MIFESAPWKAELDRHLRHFKTWARKCETERGGFYIERGVFLSAFIVRKLMENRKVTDEVRSRPVSCTSFFAFEKLSDSVARFWGVSDPTRHYDFSKPATLTLGAYDLMSEIMHSYIFIPVADEGGIWIAFLVNSYRNRDDRLLQIERTDFENVLAEVIRDGVGYASVSHHPTSNKVIADIRGRPPHPSK